MGGRPGQAPGGREFLAIAEDQQNPTLLDDNPTLRQALLDFIADFANWDNSTVREYLDTSRALPRPRTKRWAVRLAPGRLSWTRLPAAAPSRSKPCE